MNCEPCNSLEITCNHNVTIGYLKEFVANLPIGCCNSITVNGDNNTYCPTYGELTNGTIVPSFSDGGENAWSNNVDGIYINPVYSANQCVAKKDLKLIYTAFESLVISNNSTTVSECSGTTTTIKELKFRKYTKECDKTPTYEEQIDLVKEVEWSGTDGTNTGVKTYLANDSFTDEHSTEVKCSFMWRGCMYTSNVITVKQAPRRRNGYSDSETFESGTSLDVQCYPIAFDCRGGTSIASAVYYYTTWNVRHYFDSCGVEYGQEKVNVTNTSMTVTSEALDVTSHTYDCQITTSAQSKFEFYGEYKGLTGKAICYQECDYCGVCPPPPFTSYTSVTASCTASTATVNGHIHTFTGGHLDGEGNCVDYSETLTPTSYTVNWECTTHGGWIDNNVFIADAPCCPTLETYTYDNVEVPCESANSTTMSVGYTHEVHKADGTVEITRHTNDDTPIPAHNCNSTRDPIVLQTNIIASTLEMARPGVTQAAGPCCCYCESLTMTGGVVESAGGSNIIIGTYSPSATCVSNLRAEDVDWVSHIQFVNGNIYANVAPYTSTVASRRLNIIVYGSSDSVTNCQYIITVTQLPVSCTCDKLSIDRDALSWDWDETANTSSVTVTYDSCISDITKNSLTHFTITSARSTNAIVFEIRPTSENTTQEAYEEALTISYKANVITNEGTSQINCSSAITLTQNNVSCICSNLLLTGVTVSSEGGTHVAIGEYNSDTCVTNLVAVSDENWVSNITFGADGIIYGDVEEYTETMQPRETTIRVSGTAVILNDCQKELPLMQNPADCICDLLSSNKNSLTWNWNDADVNSSVTITYDQCITNIEKSSLEYFGVTSAQSTNAITLNIYPLINNETLDVYEETLTIYYNAGVTNCHIDISLSQANKPCVCDDLQLTNDTLSWEFNEVDTKNKSYTISAGREACVTNVEVSPVLGTSNSHFTTSIDTVNNTISITPKSIAGQNAISEVINVNYNSGTQTCVKQFNVLHKGSNCSCDDFVLNIDSTKVEWGYSDIYSHTVATYELASCQSNLTVTLTGNDDDKFTVAASNGKIIVTPVGYNDSTSDYEATIIVRYTANGNSCTDRTIDVIQKQLDDVCELLPQNMPTTLDFDAS